MTFNTFPKHEALRVRDDDFVDPNLDDIDALNDNEVDTAIRQRLPIILPWHKGETPRLGTCLYSSRLKTEHPWEGDDSPFLLAHLYRVPPVLTREYGTTASYKSISTSRQCETRDHLALGFGIGVGIPFLASASVKGTYDKDVRSNTDSNKASIQASIRAGTVELSAQPRLTNKAIRMIKYGGGIEVLEAEYGDYYVAGYRLGGDTAMLISSSSNSTLDKEVYGVTLTAEVLLIESSTHWDKEFNVLTSGSSLRLLGYDTLDGERWNEASTGSCSQNSAATLHKTSKEIAMKTQCLDDRLSKILDEMGLVNGQDLTQEQCHELAKSGVVVELVLLPIRTVRHVMEWIIQDNII